MPADSPVLTRLRALLEEARLSGSGPIDLDRLARRFPAHRADVRRLHREVFGMAELEPPIPGSPSVLPMAAPRVPGFPSAPEPASAPHPEPEPEPEPEQESPPTLRVVRQDAEGRLLEGTGGTCHYVVPADSQETLGPATFYLQRAERLSRCAVAGVQRPRVAWDAGGSRVVSFEKSPPESWSFDPSVARRPGATYRALGVLRQVAETLHAVHAAGAAHGDLRRESLRHAPDAPGGVFIDGDLESGPGWQRAEELEEQQLDDVRALGSLLYGALSLSRGEPEVVDIVARHQTGNLPPLVARRPHLAPALLHLVERALHAGTSEPTAYASMEELCHDLDLLVDLDTAALPEPAPATRPLRGVALPLSLLVATALVVLLLQAFLS